MIRLAVRCRPEQAELVLAELTVLAPNGVEEERGPRLRRVRDLRRRGRAAGAGRARGRRRRRAGRGRRDRGPRRLGRPLAGLPQAAAGRRAALAAPVLGGAAARGPIDVVVDPGRAFGTGAHPTTRLCLEYLLELADAGEAGGAADRPRHRLRRPRDRRREARLGPGRRLRPRAAVDRGGERERRGQRRRGRLRAPQPPRGAAGARPDRGRQHDRARCCADSPRCSATSRAPRTLVLSGLLPAEVDDIAAVVRARSGCARRPPRDGDWAALLLRSSRTG